MEEGTFEHIHPLRHITFTFPNPHPNNPPYGDLLHIAVLDSPIPSLHQQQTSAMLVPVGRESDWIFSTIEGHLQLLLGSLSHRLLLIGNVPNPTPPIYTRFRNITQQFEQSLVPLLFALCPKSAFSSGLPHVPFLSFDDGVVRSVIVEKAVGPVVGEMLVEDVEMEAVLSEGWSRTEMRRRLRFRRMPNLVQSQIRIMPFLDAENCTVAEWDAGSILLQPYLAPMVAGLWLVAPLLEERLMRGVKGRVLCLGVGGGILPMFLKRQLGFDVLGVEVDDVVLSIARRHFGFDEGDFLRVCVGDGIELMQSFAHEDRGSGEWKEKFGKWWDCVGEIDAVMVDLDSRDSENGIVAPPLEFVRRDVVIGARATLHKGGILVINAVPFNKSHYLQLIGLFHEVFSQVYEIEVGNDENHVLVATVSPICGSDGSGDGDYLLRKNLEKFIGFRFLHSIKKKA